MKAKNSHVDNKAITRRLNQELASLGCLPERGKITVAAKIMGITAPSARKIVGGESLPSAETLAFLASKGVDVNYLLTGQNVKVSRERLQDLMVEYINSLRLQSGNSKSKANSTSSAL